jgi:uncharacterized protein YyaL (SSP411 family)
MIRYFIFILSLSLMAVARPEFVNHLEGEPSPYLRQHVHNPVDWYPWGDEAFEKARKEHKPIFLSIGYSTCHWCHVMAHESFENPQIAALINRWFVPVKVDREEMPHLDRYYQRVFTLLRNRSGGWPLTIFLTEDLKPFFAATYIPPSDSYGVRGLTTLLPYFGRLYRTDRARIDRRAAAIETLMKKMANMKPKPIEADLFIAKMAVDKMWRYYDNTYKGFGDHPKFPESSRLRLLLDIYRLNGDERAKKMALETLEAMASSGLYDQIDGAFFRYCVDRAWTMPHFEKMLYTNAELIPLYVEAWKMTGNGRYAEVVRETIAEIDRRFRTKEGLYFSASNADSDHQEGGYFLYRYDEALEALKDAGFSDIDAKAVLAYLDIAEDGNFDTEYSHARRMADHPPKRFDEARTILKALRKPRTYPFIDTKIITAWNAMMVKALFSAGAIDATYLDEAETSYRALKKTMTPKNGGLFHQFLYGDNPTQPGLLEDYAFMGDAALTAYQATLDPHYLADAKMWTDRAIQRFYKKEGRWLLSDDGFQSYADMLDNYYTSPLSVIVNNLLDLALLESDIHSQSLAKATLDANGLLLSKRPDAYPEALRASIRLTRGIVGLKGDPRMLEAYRKKIDRIHYPFLLLKAEEAKGFLACDMRSCFAFSKDFESVKAAIEKR